jgi:hypothetical protein
MLTNSKLTGVLFNVNQRARQRSTQGKAPAASVTVRFAEDRDNVQVSALLWHAFGAKVREIYHILSKIIFFLSLA